MTYFQMVGGRGRCAHTQSRYVTYPETFWHGQSLGRRSTFKLLWDCLAVASCMFCPFDYILNSSRAEMVLYFYKTHHPHQIAMP